MFMVTIGGRFFYQAIGRKEKPWSVSWPQGRPLWIETNLKHFHQILGKLQLIMWTHKAWNVRISRIRTHFTSRSCKKRISTDIHHNSTHEAPKGSRNVHKAALLSFEKVLKLRRLVCSEKTRYMRSFQDLDDKLVQQPTSGVYPNNHLHIKNDAFPRMTMFVLYSRGTVY